MSEKATANQHILPEIFVELGVGVKEDAVVLTELLQGVLPPPAHDGNSWLLVPVQFPHLQLYSDLHSKNSGICNEISKVAVVLTLAKTSGCASTMV